MQGDGIEPSNAPRVQFRLDQTEYAFVLLFNNSTTENKENARGRDRTVERTKRQGPKPCGFDHSPTLANKNSANFAYRLSVTKSSTKVTWSEIL